MKYTKRQIMPKQYPNEKPSKPGKYRVLLDDGKRGLFEWGIYWGESNWDDGVKWFIDISDPPSELEFLAYPIYKPEKGGEYLCHNKLNDEWFVSTWYGKELFTWRELVDWYISYRLDEENEMIRKKIYMFNKNNNIPYSQDMSFLRGVPSGIKFTIKENEMFNNKDTVMLVAKGYGNEDDYGNGAIYVYRKYLDKENETDVIWGNINGIQIIDDGHGLLIDTKRDKPTRIFKTEWIEIMNVLGEKFGYDVVKREPEIAQCPNPECDGKPFLHFNAWCGHWFGCNKCHYRSPAASTEKEAKRLHSLIAKRAKAKSEYMDFGKGRE